jgi:hypothetical protein
LQLLNWQKVFRARKQDLVYAFTIAMTDYAAFVLLPRGAAQRRGASHLRARVWNGYTADLPY